MTDSTELTVVEAELGTLPARSSDSVMSFAGHDEKALDTRWRIATMLVKSGLVPQKRPEEVMGVMLKAYEMGIPVMQACATMHMVNGRFGMEAAMMDALAIQRCGVRKQVLEQTPEKCVLVLKREDWDDLTVTYTMEDAKLAGLSNKDNYKRHPAAMLYARALSRGIKQIAPDYFTSIYVLEELEHELSMQPAAGSNRSTDDELDALIAKGTEAVEPDPDIFSDDEIDVACAEFRDARKAELVSKDEEVAFSALIATGQWADARAKLAELRML